MQQNFKSGSDELAALKRTSRERKSYEPLAIRRKKIQTCKQFHQEQFQALSQNDAMVYQLITQEFQRQRNTLQLGAAENQCSQQVLAALGSVLQNKTAEGTPQNRIHGGCKVADKIEKLAIERAKAAFGAKYANVQPHCGTAANQIVIAAVLEKEDKILSMNVNQGGHFSHGAENTFTGKFFNVENYSLDEKTLTLDYEAIKNKAIEVKPKLIICGASAYPRKIDFEKFRQIADEVGAYLLADISHISSLILAGLHSSPINYAHFTTTSTYKPGGPRGGLVLMGKDFAGKIKIGEKQMALCERIDEMTFPGLQGTPQLNNIAAKAVFFKEVLSDEYKNRQKKIIENAKQLADDLITLGYNVLTGGTDNHMVIIDVANFKEGLTGLAAQKILDDCSITVDMIGLPYDKKPAKLNSGIRIGTPIVTKQGMTKNDMAAIAKMLDEVLKKAKVISNTDCEIDEPFKQQMCGKIADFCSRFNNCNSCNAI